ncbi:MAG: D-2-hydroxyacid dehydrogenase [Muribaculaceae bacterium]|nr:D-2-hydroxyacid dehydrogenase [Muribaculaceae bacterium]
MNITILDGYSVNPGDLSWKEIASEGDLTVYDRTAPEEVIERAKGSEIVLTNKVVLDADVLAQLPELKYIGILATGVNVVDIREAERLGIVVTNIPSYSTMSVAQSVFALLLAFTNSTEHYSDQFHAGEWAKCPDFCFVDTDLTELAGKKFGIIGYGHIGRAVAVIARAFGMEVYAASSKSQEEIPEVKKQNIDEIFASCDVVTLHCPLTEDTFHLADSRRINSMKPTSILINTARGPLVDEEALAEALKEGRIRGAGLDVLGQEPPRADNPLTGAPRCIVTPHIAWATKEARTRLIAIAASNLRAFLAGTPVNRVLP